MTPQQKEQLIKELENCKTQCYINAKKCNDMENAAYYHGQINAYSFAIALAKQTTVNRSSSEPKIIEG